MKHLVAALNSPPSTPQVDVAGFDAAMEAQKARSKASREEVDLTAGSALASVAEEVRSRARPCVVV